jgi:acyl carrier protein
MVFDKLLEIFENVIPEVDTADISEESTLFEDLGLNSLTMMLLAVSVEDEFDIKFDDVEALETVGDVCDFIREKTGEE